MLLGRMRIPDPSLLTVLCFLTGRLKLVRVSVVSGEALLIRGKVKRVLFFPVVTATLKRGGGKMDKGQEERGYSEREVEEKVKRQRGVGKEGG